MTAPPSQPDGASNGSPRFASLAMALIAVAIVVGGIFSGVFNYRADDDQNTYHLQVIRQFARELPTPDFSDYYSATGPLYHVLLAPVERWVAPGDVRSLRLVSGLFTVILLATLGWAVGRRVNWPTAVVLCLPMAVSLYVFLSTAWLLPDNSAWLTVLFAMLLAFRERVDRWTFIGAAVVVAAAVGVRQINLWPLGVLVVAVSLAHPTGAKQGQPLAIPFADRWMQRAGLMLLAGVPALAVLAWFHHLWHGLTPPAFQTVPGPLPPGHSKWEHEGPNFAVPAMVLSVLAMTGFFFLPILWPTIREVLTKRGRLLAVVIAGILLGAAAALIPPTEYTPPPGPRYSGLWNVSARFPAVAHRSLFMTGCAAAGGTLVALWFLALNARDRWIWLMTWFCFAAAQSANAKAWQKYYEPFCLMMLALVAARVIQERKPPKWAIIGPVVLTLILAGITIANLSMPEGG